jgi:hypothetical protein
MGLAEYKLHGFHHCRREWIRAVLYRAAGRILVELSYFYRLCIHGIHLVRESMKWRVRLDESKRLNRWLGKASF